MAAVEMAGWTAEDEAKVQEVNIFLAQLSRESLGLILKLNLSDPGVRDNATRKAARGWQSQRFSQKN